MRGTPPTLLRLSLALVTRCLLASGLVSCASATGEVRGGGPREGYDAAAPAPFVPGGGTEEEIDADAPPTSWRAIYRDFFGRRSLASCAGNGTCHDAPDKAGAQLSFFVCGDLEGCFQSMRTGKDPNPQAGARALVEDADIADPANAYLFKVLRLRTADGKLVPNRGMPQQPRDFAYGPEDVERMQTWIKNGAKND